ncbi:MAG: hypothetical protein GC201_05115 [Alphaproteobacteria bacterium]|nr:hypothetical protein [Alphaproteobacteria bacterium]
MNRYGLVASAVVLSAGVSVPAMAAWNTIGSVNFDRHGDHERNYTDFGGPVERIELSARGEDVQCRRVTATFGNGHHRRIFNGTIRRGRPVSVDLPGNERHVRRLDFGCRSLGRHEARINIGVDAGQFFESWMRNPRWAPIFGSRERGHEHGRQAWNRDHHHGRQAWNRGHDRWDHRNRRGRNDQQGWVTLSRERFQGRHDREAIATGWRGRSVDRLAFRALDDDARCGRVRATFGNGHSRNLNTSDLHHMRQGKFYRVDLPGRERHVTRIHMVCHAVGDRDVTIQVYARK